MRGQPRVAIAHKQRLGWRRYLAEGAFYLEVAMRKSIVSALALSALVAGGMLAGAAQAQTTPLGNDTGVSAGTGAMGPGIGPGTRPGVGPPTDGLDSNPYAEAPQVRKALGGTARANQTAPRQSARGSGASTSSGGAKAGASSSQN